MNKQEIARLVASLTDDELDQLRDFLADAEDTNQHGAADREYVKALFGGGE